jgi:hypothetical protein
VLAGDVGRDIALKLDDAQDMPVSIDTGNGSAVLRLTAPLDKEGLEGPSSITVGVICDRLGTEDPGFTIPIYIRYAMCVKRDQT